MEELITLVKELKVATANWNAKCKKRFYFSDVVLVGDRESYHRIGTGMYRDLWQIEVLVNKLLITEDGKTHYSNEELLIKETGVQIVTLEQDSFGPLRKGILIGYGMVCYG